MTDTKSKEEEEAEQLGMGKSTRQLWAAQKVPSVIDSERGGQTDTNSTKGLLLQTIRKQFSLFEGKNELMRHFSLFLGKLWVTPGWWIY